MKLLVTGTSGQLAQSLLAAGLAEGVDVVALRRPQLDLTVPGTIRAALADARPDIVVNAAAYTAVDKAEGEPDLAMSVNATGAGELAAQCARAGVPIIHVSTDYVFDGTSSAPYREDDATAPINAYGRSKLAGEVQVARANPRHVIVRTSWIYSPYGINFVRTMLRLAQSRSEVGVVDDQWGAPTYAPHLAQAILSIARQLPRTADGGPWGVFHAAGGGEATWCGFAREIFALAAERGLKVPEVKAIATVDYPTPARRPGNSRLDCSKLAAVFGVVMPEWQAGARACVERLV
jgi:dTDP-4-dehydrorhamnose reductase